MREAAEVMAPLLGCWSGSFDNQSGITDERCFSVLDGRHVVDVHEVRPTSYAGETTYHLDETNGHIVFAYVSNDGGLSHGVLRPVAGGFEIPAHDFRNADGTRLRLRSNWALDSAGRLIMTTKREEGGVWRLFMRISYERAAR